MGVAGAHGKHAHRVSVEHRHELDIDGSDTIVMSRQVYVGLAVTSHNPSALTTALLSNVSVIAGATNQLPTVSLTSPANGTSYVAPASIALSATASDPDGSVARVEFYAGSTLLATDTTAPYSHTWTIFDQVGAGHEIAVADLNGDGRSDVIANDNSRNAGGVHVFCAPDAPANGEWRYQRDEDGAAMNSCVAADLNGDSRLDLVCTGGGGVIRWYENLGS
jgi:hypothetical protein